MSIVTALLVTAGPASLRASDSARSQYKQGQAAEARQDYDAAYNEYRKATLEEPSNLKYKVACERTKPLAAAQHVKRGKELKEEGKTTDALTEFLRATAIDPSNEAAEQAIADLEVQISPSPQKSDVPQLPSQRKKLARLAAPVELKSISDEPITLHSVEDSKVIYQTVGRLAGINILFDPEYTSKRIQVDLTNVDLSDALRIIGTISGTFWLPITSNTIFVAQNNRAKRTEHEEEAVQTFYLTNVAQQNDFTELQTALRNMFQTAKIYGAASQNAIIMRGTPDELLLAQKLIDDLDKPRPEVVIDVTVMQVDRDKVRNIGMQWPQTLSVTLTTPSSSSSSSSSSLTLNDLAYLNAKDFSLTVGTAQANLLLTDSDTQIMQNPRLRATDGQKATMKIGQRIPVATGSYTYPTSTSASAAQTQFQYIDIGVVMEMTPTIHYDGDVTLKVKVEITSHDSDTTISGVTEPIIGQQSVEEMIRLKEGETNILGGLLQEQNNLTVSGTPGLGEVPFLKYLFSTQEHTVQHEEIVFLITPHLVRGMRIDPLNLRQIDTGTSNAIQLREVQTTPAQAAP